MHRKINSIISKSTHNESKEEQDVLKTIFKFNFDRVFDSDINGICSLVTKNSFRKINLDRKYLRNALIIQGPLKSGKSTFLRGNSKASGVLLEVLKDLFKVSVECLPNDLIIIKIGCFIYQDEELSCLSKSQRGFNDEVVIVENNSFIIEQAKTIENIAKIIQKAICSRCDYLQAGKSSVLIFHTQIETKTLEDGKYKDSFLIQNDFFEINELVGDEFSTTVFINKLTTGQIPVLCKILDRTANGISYLYAVLCLTKPEEGEFELQKESLVLKDINRASTYSVLHHLKSVERLKGGLNRVNLMNTEETCCDDCFNLKKEFTKAFNFHKELNMDIQLISEDIQKIYWKIRENKKKEAKTGPETGTGKVKALSNHNLNFKQYKTLYKKLTSDSNKLEKLMKDVNSIKKRTDSNIGIIQTMEKSKRKQSKNDLNSKLR